MTIDESLAALGLVQLVARLDAEGNAPARREELNALLAGCDLERVALNLAGMLLALAETTRFPLAALLAAERRDLLSGGDGPAVA
jgi:hypothetical protein